MFAPIVKHPPRAASARRCSHLLKALLVILALQLVESTRARQFDPYSSSSSLIHQQGAVAQTSPDITTLELGKLIEREVGRAQKHTYQLTLDEGQYAGVVVEQRGIDLLVRVLGPDGKQISEFDDEIRPNGQEMPELVAGGAGSYRLSVESKRQNDPVARYTIRVSELRAANDRDRSVQDARGLFAESFKLWRGGKYDAALIPATAALEAREKALGPEHPQVATALNNLGVINYLKGDLDKAQQLYQRALKIRERAFGSDSPAVASTLNNIAELHRLRGEYAAADPLYRHSIQSWERSLGPDHTLIALPLTNLAIVRRVLGDYAESETLYLRALEIREKGLGPEHLEVASSLNNLGALYMFKGDFSKAELMFKRAFEIWQHQLGEEHPNLAAALTNLATIEQSRGNLDQAEQLYKRSLKVWEKAVGADHPSFAEALDNLGSLLRDNGDVNEAEAMLQRALGIREKALGLEHPDVATSLNNLGKLYTQKGDFDKAESLFQRALTIREKTLGPNHSGVSESLTNIAAVDAAKGNIEQAVEKQAKANVILERNIALNLLTGSERQKLAFMSNLSETTDRTLSLHTVTAPDNSGARLLAATTILQRKGRVQDATSDELAGLRRRFSVQDQKLLDQLNDTTGRLARLVVNGPEKTTLAEHQQQIAAVYEQKEQIENEISRRSAGFYQPTESFTLKSVQAAIPPQAALIEIAAYRPFNPKAENNKKAFGEQHYVAYVLHHEGEVQSADLGLSKPIDDAIDVLRLALRDPKRTNVKELARAVDQKVMQPLMTPVGDATQLLVSTDGALNLIPFEALVDEQGNYLVERFAFTYLTSGRDLLRMHVAREGNGKTTIFANPAFGEPMEAEIAKASMPGGSSALGRRRSVTAAPTLAEVYFAPLSGTGQEALKIQTLFPESILLTGTQATESALKALSKPRILHVATHGFFLQDAEPTAAENVASNTRSISARAKIENPLLRSGLALSGANLRTPGATDDGILTALEASGLNLWGTKLVVLSACDTGLGEVRNGEGVYGLRRAFVLAGAESLVMSLWPVSDYATRNLMINYYKNLKLGMGRGAALRQVQLDLLKRDRQLHPFYWANFIQSGEWANLEGKR